jgi:2-iminobutanoate/2-iminopropanoate deaminase
MAAAKYVYLAAVVLCSCLYLIKFAFCLVNLCVDRKSMETISTDKAPGAIGPYSQAIKAGGMVFCSGQIPISVTTGEFVSDDVAEQTEQVMKNLREVLEAAGTGLENVVKTTVFLADMGDFAAMNEVYGRYFDSNKPARATVQAARLPRDARVEIDCIAVVQGA